MTTILTQRMTDQPRDSHTLERYGKTGGYQALRKGLGQMSPEQVAAEVDASKLRGRGGAGFATGKKWGFLADSRPRYLVVNADESEPGTFKDRQLLERDPHQLLEGIILSCYALDVHHCFIYVRGEYARPARRVQGAVEEAYRAGYLGSDILGSGFGLDITLHLGAGAYICGEETAMLNSLEGKRGEPRIRPPYPAVQGVYDKPTVVNNVETLSNVPWIVEHGGAAYAALGTEGSTGTRLFSLSGHVKRPGNYEVELGMPFRELIYDLGGGIRDDRRLKAFIPGGASAPWLLEEHLDLPLDIDAMTEVGSMLGSGGVTAMDEATCMVRAALRLVRFFAHESCGECTPCREGTGWLERVLARIEHGAGRTADLDLLLDVSDNISPGLNWPPAMTTICGLGPSAVQPITSGLTYFKDEFMRHIHEGGCPFA
ncbi:MAG: NADH-quinone oxidoreductase subunit NuoF [Actinomycetota bacterium]|nr:NADH-quinone oxidoreductase subunit NuoF [Actinomycetota bacterium]